MPCRNGHRRTHCTAGHSHPHPQPMAPNTATGHGALVTHAENHQEHKPTASPPNPEPRRRPRHARGGQLTYCHLATRESPLYGNETEGKAALIVEEESWSNEESHREPKGFPSMV